MSGVYQDTGAYQNAFLIAAALSVLGLALTLVYRHGRAPLTQASGGSHSRPSYSRSLNMFSVRSMRKPIMNL